MKKQSKNKGLKITNMTLGRVVSTGEYETARIQIQIEIDPEVSFDSQYEKLKEIVDEKCLEISDEGY